MNVLQKVHHPHCVQFFGAVTKQKPFMIITEFMGCGSMADMFRAAGESLLGGLVILAGRSSSKLGALLTLGFTQ